MWKVTYKGLLAKKFRLALTSLAVVLGVAFMAGTFVLTDTLGNVFDELFANTTKGVDAVVRARKPFDAASDDNGNQQTRPPVPESLVATVQSVRGVDRAQGSVFGFALVAGKDGDFIQNQAPTFGTSWYPQKTSVSRSLDLIRGRQPSSDDEVALDQKTFQDGDFKVGDRTRITFTTTQRVFTITGVVQFGGKENGLAGATLSAFTPATAQEVLNRVGQWDQIDVRGDPGLSETEVRDRIRRALRAEDLPYQAITGEQLAKEQSDDIKSNLSFFNILLLIFALISLFVGAFIIYNTFSITVAQRLRELGLLRGLGASGRQVIASVAFEALAVGLLSSIVGLLLGLAIVKPLEALLSAFGIDLPTGSLQVLPRTIIVSLLVGTLVTVVSALAPARRAARIPPIAALRDHAIDVSSGRRRYIWGLVATVVGFAALGLGLFGGASGSTPALLTGVAAFLVFIGVAMLSPLFARPAARALTWPAEKTHSITGILAQQNAMRNPRRTASTAAALMIGLALVTFIAIFGESAKQTFASSIDDQTNADFILSPKNFQPFSSEAAQAVRRQLPGATVVEYRFGTVAIKGTSHAVTGASPDFTKMTDVSLRPGARLGRFADGGLLVYKDVASDEGYEVGDRLRVEFPLGPRTLAVQGVYTDKKALPGNGNYIVSLADWDGFTDSLDTYVGVLKPPGVSTQEAERVVKRVAARFGGIEAQNKAEFRDSQLAQFDQILGLMYALLLLAVVIALVGIVNTLALSIYERTREIGLLRAVGMSRVQLRRMIRGEALIVALFGALLGLVIGLVFGRAIVQALSDQGFNFALPVGQLVAFLILAALAGLLAGVLPARRAAHLDVLTAVKHQ